MENKYLDAISRGNEKLIMPIVCARSGCTMDEFQAIKNSVRCDGRNAVFYNLYAMKIGCISLYELRGYIPDFAETEDADFTQKLSKHDILGYIQGTLESVLNLPKDVRIAYSHMEGSADKKNGANLVFWITFKLNMIYTGNQTQRKDRKRVRAFFGQETIEAVKRKL